MKRLLLFLLLLLIFSAPAVPQSAIWCDFHGQYAYYNRHEYPSGTCYKIYKHDRPFHEIAVRCK